MTIFLAICRKDAISFETRFFELFDTDKMRFRKMVNQPSKPKALA